MLILLKILTVALPTMLILCLMLVGLVGVTSEAVASDGAGCCCCCTRNGFRVGHSGDLLNFFPHDSTLHLGTQTNQYTNVTSIIKKGSSTEHVNVM